MWWSARALTRPSWQHSTRHVVWCAGLLNASKLDVQLGLICRNPRAACHGAGSCGTHLWHLLLELAQLVGLPPGHATVQVTRRLQQPWTLHDIPLACACMHAGPCALPCCRAGRERVMRGRGRACGLRLCDTARRLEHPQMLAHASDCIPCRLLARASLQPRCPAAPTRLL
jgi:hypothetical protein